MYKVLDINPLKLLPRGITNAEDVLMRTDIDWETYNKQWLKGKEILEHTDYKKIDALLSNYYIEDTINTQCIYTIKVFHRKKGEWIKFSANFIRFHDTFNNNIIYLCPFIFGESISESISGREKETVKKTRKSYNMMEWNQKEEIPIIIYPFRNIISLDMSSLFSMRQWYKVHDQLYIKLVRSSKGYPVTYHSFPRIYNKYNILSSSASEATNILTYHNSKMFNGWMWKFPESVIQCWKKLNQYKMDRKEKGEDVTDKQMIESMKISIDQMDKSTHIKERETRDTDDWDTNELNTDEEKEDEGKEKEGEKEKDEEIEEIEKDEEIDKGEKEGKTLISLPCKELVKLLDLYIWELSSKADKDRVESCNPYIIDMFFENLLPSMSLPLKKEGSISIDMDVNVYYNILNTVNVDISGKEFFNIKKVVSGHNNITALSKLKNTISASKSASSKDIKQKGNSYETGFRNVILTLPLDGTPEEIKLQYLYIIMVIQWMEGFIVGISGKPYIKTLTNPRGRYVGASADLLVSFDRGLNTLLLNMADYDNTLNASRPYDKKLKPSRINLSLPYNFRPNKEQVLQEIGPDITLIPSYLFSASLDKKLGDISGIYIKFIDLISIENLEPIINLLLLLCDHGLRLYKEKRILLNPAQNGIWQSLTLKIIYEGFTTIITPFEQKFIIDSLYLYPYLFDANEDYLDSNIDMSIVQFLNNISNILYSKYSSDESSIYYQMGDITKSPNFDDNANRQHYIAYMNHEWLKSPIKPFTIKSLQGKILEFYKKIPRIGQLNLSTVIEKNLPESLNWNLDKMMVFLQYHNMIKVIKTYPDGKRPLSIKRNL